MNTLNHALWGATIGRVVGLSVEGAIFGSLPDIISVPPLGFHLLTQHRELGWSVTPQNSPKWMIDLYRVTHNWFFGIGLIIVLKLISQNYAILGLAYFWHIIEDAFVHTDMATAFLYPVWKGKIQVISASDSKWIQIVDLFLIVIVNVALSFVKL